MTDGADDPNDGGVGDAAKDAAPRRFLLTATEPMRRALWRVRNRRASRRELRDLAITGGTVVVGTALALLLTVGRLGGTVGSIVAALLWLLVLGTCLFPLPGVRRLARPRPAAQTVVTGSSPVWAKRIGALARAEQALATRNRPEHAGAVSLLPPPAGTPTVAIVVAAYNEQDHIGDCLASLIAQTFTDWECIVVDDDSKDDTPEIVARVAAEDSRVRLVRHSHNRGLSAVRNTGLTQVRAPLVTFLDADDVITADSLADRVNAFLQWEAPDLAGTFCGLYQVSKIDLSTLPPSYPWVENRPTFVDLASAGGVNPFGVHQPLIRTDVARALGGFDETFRVGAEDYDFWMRVMRAGYHFRPSYRLTALYRQKAGSMVRDLIVEHYDACRQILNGLDEPRELSRPSADAPWPIQEPLGSLQRKLVLAERAVRSAGFAVGLGKPEHALTLLSRIEPQVAELALRHVNLGWSIGGGLRRAWGLTRLPADDDSLRLRPQMRRLQATVREMLVDRAAPLRQGPVEVREPRQVDLLLCPTNAAHAREMARAADQASALFLSLDELCDQGASAAAATTGIDQVRLLELVGEGIRFRSLVISEPLNYWVHAFAQAVIKAGGSVLVLDGPASLPALAEAGVSASGVAARRVQPSGLATSAEGDHVCAADLDLTVLAPPPDVADPVIAEEARHGRDWRRLAQLKDAYAGQRCVIIGNGPSLNDMDLRLLADVPTFAVNGIFYAQDRMGFEPTFYVVEDDAVMTDNTERIRDYPAQWKLFPSIYRKYVGNADNTMYFRMNRGFYRHASPHYCVPRFSTDASTRVYCGQSVTIINLQLAYYFGFTEVALIGMDFSYTIPDTAERNGDVLTSTEGDPNHFHPDYFGAGKRWKDPKLDRVLINYELAKRMYEADGRRIVNATLGGKLDVFPRVDYSDFLR